MDERAGNKKDRILMIGAHGMLGRPVARRLLADGFSVRAMARHPEKAKAVLPSSLDVVQGNLEDVGSMDRALDGCHSAYLSVDTPPKARFHSETEGLKNLIKAARNHPDIRLFVLSALRSSDPGAKNHPWWHAREKFEAQQIATSSGLAWTLFEPTWFMESLPLFIKGKNFYYVKCGLEAYWISGDDFGRIFSALLKKNIGQEEIVPIQGPEKYSLLTAARRFIQAYDPAIKIRTVPAFVLTLAGLVQPQAKELATLLALSDEIKEEAPSPEIWERTAQPMMSFETYAYYVRRTNDFPQK